MTCDVLVILLLLLLEFFIWNEKPRSMRRGGGGTDAVGGEYGALKLKTVYYKGGEGKGSC